MSISANGQGTREKVRTPKVKSLQATPSSSSQGVAVSVQRKDEATTAAVDRANSSQDAKNPPR